MAMDAFRQGETFEVSFDVPGVDAESIELTVERNVLTVKAERRRPQIEGAQYVATERPQGVFTRRLSLGQSLDTDRIEARYHDGVLTLVIPVTSAARPRRIEVSGAATPSVEAPAADEAPVSDEAPTSDEALAGTSA
jgi:HSP20 family protein